MSRSLTPRLPPPRLTRHGSTTSSPSRAMTLAGPISPSPMSPSSTAKLPQKRSLATTSPLCGPSASLSPWAARPKPPSLPTRSIWIRTSTFPCSPMPLIKSSLRRIWGPPLTSSTRAARARSRHRAPMTSRPASSPSKRHAQMRNSTASMSLSSPSSSLPRSPRPSILRSSATMPMSRSMER